jgi:hypothetical protein
LSIRFNAGGELTTPFPLDDRAALKEFLSQTHALLDEIAVHGGPLGGPTFVPADLQPLLRDAWPTAGADLLSLHKAVDTADAGTLATHGLTGPSLRFKLGVVQRAWSNFAADRLLKWLRKLLAAIDTLLESIIDALGPAGAAAKELKQALENLLEELDED